MSRSIIHQTQKYQIFVKVYRLGKKTKIIEYTHVLGAVEKQILEEISIDHFNYITKDHKEQIKKSKELIEKMKTMEAKYGKV